MGFGTSGKKFVYEKRDASAAIARSHESTNQRDSYIIAGDFKYFKLKENNDHNIRPLPPTWDKESLPQRLLPMSNSIFNEKGKPSHWAIDIWVHYRIGVNDNSYLCAEKMLGEPCPICEDIRTSNDTEYIRQLSPVRRVLLWIIDRDNENAGPILWAPPFSVDKDMLGVSTDPKQGIARSVDNPDEGYDVSFRIEGKIPMVKYKTFKLSFSPCSISESKDKYNAWLEYISKYPLPSLLEFHNYDKIYKEHHGKKFVQKQEVQNTVVEDEKGKGEKEVIEKEEGTDPKIQEQIIKPVTQTETKPMTASEMLRAKFKKT